MVSLQAGWVGKGKNPNASVTQEHTSRPLQTLKDPSAFGPPPKNVNYHGGAAVPNAITPDRRGLGAPLSADEVQATRQQEEEAEAAAKKPTPPPIPYRVDRTGLSTSNLPPPPTRAANPNEAEVQSPATKPKPRLPPRLPPRQNSHPGETTPAPPPPYSVAIEQPQQQQPLPSSFLNRAASNRLGGAGIKVPGLGIGGSSSPPPAAPPQAQSPSIAPNEQPNNPWRDQPSSTSSSTISGLTNRFGFLRTAATSSPGPSAISQPPVTSASPSGGGGSTTLAQKQAALKTARSFRNDPGSVSMADACATASTAKNFNDRHGEQVASGWRAGNKLNQQYGIADKVGGYAGQSQPATAEEARETGGNAGAGGAGGAGGGGSFGSAAAALGGFKKAPPPPPAARSNTGGGMVSPPPVPLGSKPR